MVPLDHCWMFLRMKLKMDFLELVVAIVESQENAETIVLLQILQRVQAPCNGSRKISVIHQPGEPTLRSQSTKVSSDGDQAANCEIAGDNGALNPNKLVHI